MKHCNTSLKHCSKNLTKHIKLLKTEKNRLTMLQQNGYKLTKEEVYDYQQHLQYVKKLVQTEKAVYYNKLLLDK